VVWTLYRNVALTKFKSSFHYPSWRPELTGDRFPSPVNTGSVDGRAFPLAELTGRVSRAVNSGSGNQALAVVGEGLCVSPAPCIVRPSIEWHASTVRYYYTNIQPVSYVSLFQCQCIHHPACGIMLLHATSHRHVVVARDRKRKCISVKLSRDVNRGGFYRATTTTALARVVSCACLQISREHKSCFVLIYLFAAHSRPQPVRRLRNFTPCTADTTQ